MGIGAAATRAVTVDRFNKTGRRADRSGHLLQAITKTVRAFDCILFKSSGGVEYLGSEWMTRTIEEWTIDELLMGPCCSFFDLYKIQ